MNFLKLQFLAVTALLSLSGGMGTMSFFSDTEGAAPGHFEATLLDQEVAGQPIDGLLCTAIDRVSTVLYSDNVGPLAFAYGFKVENATGTLCSGLDARLINDENGMLYDGPLLGLMADGITLAGESADELHLELRLAFGATESGTCTFDTLWSAAQLEGTKDPGYSDEERLTHFVTGSATGIGGGCTPPGDTVRLYLEKHISGEDLGFALSDFFYRITGNGFDLIVPHDSYTPLPKGVYTIEELVPDGFVKEDWRIGWYGQCERGSTFITTITIDEGNVDHGTLYCQADNQYRPAHGDNVITERRTTDDTEEVTTSSTDSSRRTASSRQIQQSPTPAEEDVAEEPAAEPPSELIEESSDTELEGLSDENGEAEVIEEEIEEEVEPPPVEEPEVEAEETPIEESDVESEAIE